MDDERSRAERAKRLRQQINKIVKGESEAGARQPAEKSKNPRDFVHRQMNELDRPKEDSK